MGLNQGPISFLFFTPFLHTLDAIQLGNTTNKEREGNVINRACQPSKPAALVQLASSWDAMHKVSSCITHT